MDQRSFANVISLEQHTGNGPSGPRLQKQASRFLENARLHRPQLAACGYLSSDETALQWAITSLESARSTRRAESERAKQTTVKLWELTSEATMLRGQLVTALRLVRDRGVPVSASLLKVGRKLTPARALEWMNEIAAVIGELQKPLAPHLPGAPLRLAALKAALFAALGEQQAARQHLPHLTAEVRRWRAEVLRGIDRLQLVARLAFGSDPTMLRQFRKQARSATRRRTAGHEAVAALPLPKTG